MLHNLYTRLSWTHPQLRLSYNRDAVTLDFESSHKTLCSSVSTSGQKNCTAHLQHCWCGPFWTICKMQNCISLSACYFVKYRQYNSKLQRTSAQANIWGQYTTSHSITSSQNFVRKLSQLPWKENENDGDHSRWTTTLERLAT